MLETNGNKWQNTEPELELQLEQAANLDSVESVPDFDLNQRLGYQDQECCKTIPIGLCNQTEKPEDCSEVGRPDKEEDEVGHKEDHAEPEVENVDEKEKVEKEKAAR